MFALQVVTNLGGLVAYYRDHYVQARARFELWITQLEELGDRGRIPFAYSLLGRIAVRQGDFVRAMALAEKSMALSVEQNNVHSIAATLNLMGTVAYCLGETGRATALLEESLGLSRGLSYQQDVADTQPDRRTPLKTVCSK